jgi:hypothetical protein
MAGFLLNVLLRNEVKLISSQAMLYSCFAIVNVFIPALISIIGPAVAMFLGAIAYL